MKITQTMWGWMQLTTRNQLTDCKINIWIYIFFFIFFLIILYNMYMAHHSFIYLFSFAIISPKLVDIKQKEHFPVIQ